MTLRMHREGKTIIPVSFLLLLIPALLWAWFFQGSIWMWLLPITSGVLFGLILNFFRNPIIHPATNPADILSPCDGKVVVIEEVEDTVYFNAKVRQISVFMSPLNVHVNRNPIGGTVVFQKYFPGEFLVAFDPKSSERNERTYVVTKNDGLTVAYKQIAGFVARRIICYIKEGDTVKQGEEYGFIKFGSRIDILIPLDAKVKVQLNEVVKAGRSVLASV